MNKVAFDKQTGKIICIYTLSPLMKVDPLLPTIDITDHPQLQEIKEDMQQFVVQPHNNHFHVKKRTADEIKNIKLKEHPVIQK